MSKNNKKNYNQIITFPKTLLKLSYQQLLTNTGAQSHSCQSRPHHIDHRVLVKLTNIPAGNGIQNSCYGKKICFLTLEPIYKIVNHFLVLIIFVYKFQSLPEESLRPFENLQHSNY